MRYNFRLFWRTAYRSFFASKNTPAQLTRKRLIFLLVLLRRLATWDACPLVLFFSG
jgi:hypothetical protein